MISIKGLKNKESFSSKKKQKKKGSNNSFCNESTYDTKVEKKKKLNNIFVTCQWREKDNMQKAEK